MSSSASREQPVELGVVHVGQLVAVHDARLRATMPTSRAIAAAVSPLSPVTTMIADPGGAGSARRRPGTVGAGRVVQRHEAEEAEVPLGLLAALRRGRPRRGAPGRRSPARAAPLAPSRRPRRATARAIGLGSAARAVLAEDPGRAVEERLGGALGADPQAAVALRRPSSSSEASGRSGTPPGGRPPAGPRPGRRRARRRPRARRPRSDHRCAARAPDGSAVPCSRPPPGARGGRGRGPRVGPRRPGPRFRRRPDRHRAHPVLGEGARLVGADDGGRARGSPPPRAVSRAHPRRLSERTPTASASVIVGRSPSGTFATRSPIGELHRVGHGQLAREQAPQAGTRARRSPRWRRSARPPASPRARAGSAPGGRAGRASRCARARCASRWRGRAPSASPPVQTVPLNTRSRAWRGDTWASIRSAARRPGPTPR